MLCGLTRDNIITSHSREDDLEAILAVSTYSELLPTGPSREDLAKRFDDLQREIQDSKVDWYIVPSEDAHQSEEVAVKDKRREWITGFTGSAGTAIIPSSAGKRGLLFVDSRYWIQAGKEVDEGRWEIRRVGGAAGQGGPGGWTDWARYELPEESRLGIDPRLIDAGTAKTLSTALDDEGSNLVPLSTNLVDKIRPAPSLPANDITHHPLRFTGESTSSKISRVRDTLDSLHMTRKTQNRPAWVYILPGLPSIAWLLNIRCDGDVPYCPVAFAYVVLTRDACVVFVDDAQVTEDVRGDWKEAGVEIRAYKVDEVGKYVGGVVKEVNGDKEKGKTKVKVLGSRECSWALSKVVEPASLEIIGCPVLSLQAKKNAVEQEGLRQAYLRDGRAMVRWMSWLEGKILKEKREVGEWAGVMGLGRFRRDEENFAGLAYEDILGSGPNGAIPHYAPHRGTDRPIDPDSTYVVDSGAQYLDGTIDTTRTLYLGDKPSDEIKRAYTRVLQGHMAVSMAQFPRGMPSDWFNLAARGFLHQDEADFGHGPGHGVGSYLGVHEYPVSFPHAFSFEPGHVTTIEPGYYKEGDFGVRIESVLLCREKQDPPPEEPKDPEKGVIGNKEKQKEWLEWERITQVPIQTSLVDWTLTTKDQIRWLNAHNTAVEAALMPLLEGDEDGEARDWLKRMCKPKKIWPWTGA